MDNSYGPVVKEYKSEESNEKIIYLPNPSSCFHLKVFYVRISNCNVNQLTPDHLTIYHMPLTPDTVLEVNGKPSKFNSDYVSSFLRRDRVDERSEEATFVSTDTVRMTGSVRFEVYIKDEALLVGALELSSTNGLRGELKNQAKKWSMKCQAAMPPRSGILRGRQGVSSNTTLSTIEVCIAGCSDGTPVILSKALKPCRRRRHQLKVVLDSIPECDPAEPVDEVPSEDALQQSDYQCYKEEPHVDIDCKSNYTEARYMEGGDVELSWFNAGFRVGVGISLGICLGIGIGVGTLIRSYHTTTRNFKRRII